MKRLFACIMTVLTCLSAFVLCGAANYEGGVDYTVLHDNTSMYAEASYESEVLAVVAKGDKVTAYSSEDIGGVTWYGVSLDGVRGYIDGANIYEEAEPVTYVINKARITTDKARSKVYVYTAPSMETGEVLTSLSDGSVVKAVGEEQNGFVKIIFNDETVGYVKADYVTTGMSYYQKLALIISLVVVGVIITILFLAYVGKNAKIKKEIG